jgi:polysaccharide export outer membrane protein
MKNPIALLLAGLMFWSSCTINSHVMLKTPKGYVFDTPPDKPMDEYIISINDILQFKLFANGGFQLIDIAAGQSDGGSQLARAAGININYVVQADSLARLPILGNINIVGKTIVDAEAFLQAEYAKFYVEPFIILTISNKRVIVFPGTGSSASVVSLSNNNTSLIEVLALVGGIATNSKASRIKIVRQTKVKKDIYLVDLSTIEGIKAGSMIVQANDIIYVEPNPNLAREALADITPVLSLLSTALLVWATFSNLKSTP